VAGPGVGVVGAGRARDLAGRIVDEARGQVVGGAGEIQLELAQPGERIVGVGGGRAVAERQAGAPPEIVIGEGGEDADAGSRAVLADMGRLAGDEMIVGDVEAVRPGQPSAATGQVPLTADGAERASLGEDAAESVVKLVTVPDFSSRAAKKRNR
jgi:hypothetical protein